MAKVEGADTFFLFKGSIIDGLIEACQNKFSGGDHIEEHTVEIDHTYLAAVQLSAYNAYPSFTSMDGLKYYGFQMGMLVMDI